MLGHKLVDAQGSSAQLSSPTPPGIKLRRPPFKVRAKLIRT